MTHDGNTLAKSSLGGSETAAIQLAEAFASKKDAFGGRNRVVVLSPCEAPMGIRGVMYIPIQSGQELMTDSDIDMLIVSRNFELLQVPHNAKTCYLWCHDLALKRTAPSFRGVLTQIDRILLMSQFQKNQYKEIYEIPEEAIEVIRNGIDPSLMPDGLNSIRSLGQMVYAARPERGLENLVKENGIMEKLAKKEIPVKLMVAHYDNTVPQMKVYYDYLWERCKALPNVQLLGHLTKSQLYDLYSRSWAYVYPTDFEEISCISAMEAQACGLPFITTPTAALVETLHPDAVKFINTDTYGPASTEDCQNEFIKVIEELLNEPTINRKMSLAGIDHGTSLSWGPVANQLLNLSNKIMMEKSSNPSRLYKHFFRNSDIEMCNKLEKSCDKITGFWEGKNHLHPLIPAEKELIYVRDNFRFMESAEAYREQYKKVDAPVGDGSIHGGAKVEHFETSENEPRWLVVKEFLETTGPYEKVLDYGCWVGHQTIRMANILPNTQFMGIDITSKTIETANKCREKYSEYKNIEFKSIDEMKSIEETNDFGNEEYDLVFCNEVLEHVIDPYILLRKLEASCKEGGTIYLTVPYGPWEYLSYYTFPHRCHIRHYEMNDILDMFGNKKDIKVFFRSSGRINSGEVIGHHFISYTKDSSIPTNNVNLERKMMWQAPRETVSVCMIAYNAEDMLHRCLKSVSKIADEIIIAVDPKTTDSTIEIAKKYGAKILQGIDPLKEGFGDARNLSIRDAKGDWIFWIDSDEILLNPENVYKYLRANPFNGYGVQQHHLSVDPPNPYKPDLPTRLFRNNKGAKFFGLIHEHPELELNKGFGLGIVIPDFWIGHDGYLTDKIRKGRFLRNIDLLLRDYKENPDRELMKFLLMRDCIHIIKDRMDRFPPGTPPDDFCREWARRAKHIFETKFLPNPSDPIMLDAIELYSAANALLGLGQDMVFSIILNGREMRDIKTRFPNSEIASQIVGGIIKHQVELGEGKYV
jgi:glycosyltransferase involved in cell wall biosynthesis/2-polyprenyl-3-methyl-5-hydroxy-6-metoxy-1,4-benzoquinol methylase